jgi:Tol biopolymer transport system component
MNADGTNLKTLSFSGTIPAWSPDGRQIALYTGPYAQPWGISVADISVVNGVPKASNIRFLVAGMRQEWSPLGDEIAYGNQTENQILVVPATGGTPTALYTVPSGTAIVRDPTWKSDGSKIAFVEITFPPGVPSQFFLKVLDRASGVVSTVLSTGHDYLFNPEWSRTSDVLAYERYIGGIEKIYTLNLSTGATSFIVDGYYPSWSPDDSKLVYSTGSAIKTITLATRAVKLLKTSTGSFLAWKR